MCLLMGIILLCLLNITNEVCHSFGMSFLAAFPVGKTHYSLDQYQELVLKTVYYFILKNNGIS